MSLSSLTQDERNELFSEYMHSIGQWKTINGQVTIVGPYVDGGEIIDGFRSFLKKK